MRTGMAKTGTGGGLPTICKESSGTREYACWAPCVARVSRCMGLSCAGGIEDGLVFEHRAGDAEQTVCDPSKRTGMTMPAGAQRGVFRFADGVALYGHPGPVVDGVLEPVVSREPADDDQRLAGPLGHGSDAGQASQGLIVSPPQGIVCFCEQRGEDDPADAGKRAQDFHVTLRIYSRRIPRGGR